LLSLVKTVSLGKKEECTQRKGERRWGEGEGLEGGRERWGVVQKGLIVADYWPGI
jgi:hypothetical protein